MRELDLASVQFCFAVFPLSLGRANVVDVITAAVGVMQLRAAFNFPFVRTGPLSFPKLT